MAAPRSLVPEVPDRWPGPGAPSPLARDLPAPISALVLLSNYHATSGRFFPLFLPGTTINILTIKTSNHTVLIMYNSIVNVSFHGRLWTEPEFKLSFLFTESLDNFFTFRRKKKLFFG
jgi:hypothetical protein